MKFFLCCGYFMLKIKLCLKWICSGFKVIYWWWIYWRILVGFIFFCIIWNFWDMCLKKFNWVFKIFWMYFDLVCSFFINICFFWVDCWFWDWELRWFWIDRFFDIIRLMFFCEGIVIVNVRFVVGFVLVFGGSKIFL